MKLDDTGQIVGRRNGVIVVSFKQLVVARRNG